MAAARAGRGSIPWGTILFAGLWVVTLVLAVYSFVQWDKSTKTEKQAKDQLKEFVSVQSPAVKLIIQAAKESRRPAMDEAADQIRQLKTAIDGATSDTELTKSYVDPTTGKIAVTLRTLEMESAPLLDALTRINTKAKNAKEEAAKAKKDQEAAAQDYARSKKAFSTQLATLSDSIKSRQSEIDKVVQEASQQTQTSQANLAKVMEEKARLEQDKDKEIRDKVTEILAKNQEIEKLQKQIKELNDILKLMRPSASVALQPSGRILRGVIGTDSYFIDLGRKDRVVPGLTFAVYDPHETIGKREDGRGKATIEVTNVGETQSLVRLTHADPGKTIVDGDVIFNQVFRQARGRTMHFVVFGDFDLDGDGVSTSSERDKVAKMMQNWGGVVDDSLSAQADYIVLGTPPNSASTKNDDQTDAGKDLQQQRAKQQEAYDKVTTQARELSVPVLNTNRFLNLIGYYNTTLVP